MVAESLKKADRSQTIALFEQIMAGRTPEALETFRTLYGYGADPGQVIGDLMEHCHAVSVAKTLGPAATRLPGDQAQRMAALGVSLSATDRIGHSYGTQGPEMCEQMLRLDTALGVLMDKLSTIPGGAIVVLTADHGGSDFPERSAVEGYPHAGRVDRALQPRVNAALKARCEGTEPPMLMLPQHDAPAVEGFVHFELDPLRHLAQVSRQLVPASESP